MKWKTIHIFCILCLLSVVIPVAGRESGKLYSIGNNVVWNNPNSWSLSPSGVACGLIPQSDDSVFITSAVVLNTDFTLSGSGCITVMESGNLKGSAFMMKLQGNASLVVSGSAQFYNLDIQNHSAFNIAANGTLQVIHDLKQLSDRTSLVDGVLKVNNILSCNGIDETGSVITGNGFIHGYIFEGNGTIMSLTPASSVAANAVLSAYTWSGVNGNDWNDPMNWSAGAVPAGSDNVAIPLMSNTPSLSGYAYCNHLKLGQGASLAVTPGSTLNIEGNLEIPSDARLSLLNTVEMPASIVVHGTTTGKITAEIQVSKDRDMLISSPVSDALSGVFVNMYLRGFDESASGWGNYIVPTDIPLNTMEGYELYSTYPSTRIFEGNPNSGIISQQITLNNEGLNLIGNPFPCYLDWKNADGSGWVRNDVGNAIYYPDPSGSGNFAVYVPGSEDISINGGSQFIAPMQGFFVKARRSGAVKVNINAAATVIDMPSNGVQRDALRFRIESADLRDESVVRIDPSSSYGFDDDFDAIKIPGSHSAFSIYSYDEEGSQMAVNTMPDLSSTSVIPLGIACRQQGEFRLTIAGGENFEYRYPLILEDQVNHVFIDLRKDSTYVFDQEPVNDLKRFLLHFDVVGGIPGENTAAPKIFSSGGNIRITGLTAQSGTIDIIGTDGSIVSSVSGMMSPEMNIPAEPLNGIFIVRITTKTTCYAHKIYIQ